MRLLMVNYIIFAAINCFRCNDHMEFHTRKKRAHAYAHTIGIGIQSRQANQQSTQSVNDDYDDAVDAASKRAKTISIYFKCTSTRANKSFK